MYTSAAAILADNVLGVPPATGRVLTVDRVEAEAPDPSPAESARTDRSRRRQQPSDSLAASWPRIL
jgi:hypothetical protein